MEKLKLKAEKRNIFGKSLAKARGQGKIPAIIYGGGKETIPIFVDFTDFKKIWSKAGETAVVELELYSDVFPVLIYDVDYNPVTRQPRHADFYAVDMMKKIIASVPIVFDEESPAIKLGGVLVKVLHEIEVEALPKDLPQEIKVDISVLKTFNDKIMVKDLKLPKEVKISSLSPDEVVALVEEKKEEEAEEKSRLNIEEIKVESGKGKKEEEPKAE